MFSPAKSPVSGDLQIVDSIITEFQNMSRKKEGNYAILCFCNLLSISQSFVEKSGPIGYNPDLWTGISRCPN